MLFRNIVDQTLRNIFIAQNRPHPFMKGSHTHLNYFSTYISAITFIIISLVSRTGNEIDLAKNYMNENSFIHTTGER